MRRHFPWLTVMLLATLFCCAEARVSCAGAPSEYQIKGAYLYHFSKFVSWPDRAFDYEHQAFRLCILGEDPFGSLLLALTKKTVNKRKIAIVHLQPEQPFDGCHLLFIARSEQERWPDIHATIRNQPILTVGDMPDFAQQGGMIHFFQSDDTLRFVINHRILLQSGLKVDAALLQIGQVIK
ncbi:MAG: YfiR family protein [Magnetococcales bacterium]|nr:YfiR family protein [Magnetococcales bacterium]